MSKTIISPAPHLHSGDSVKRNMLNVIVALIPAYCVALYYFGLGALTVSLISIFGCVSTEYIITRFLLKQRNSIFDLSAVVTGLLLAFNLPSNLPWWIVILGSVFAIGIGKMCFGGLGNNPFNPALVGRVFLLISFPADMTTWPQPSPLSTSYMDSITGATPLKLLSEGKSIEYIDLILGNIGGSMGEVCAIALIIGFIYLLLTKTITWHIPITIILTVLIVSSITFFTDIYTVINPIQQIFTGGLMLGAIYMATDYATSPMSKKGQVVYAIGIGLITIIIREFGAYPEGMSFAILIMNAFTPLINNYIKPKKFGA